MNININTEISKEQLIKQNLQSSWTKWHHNAQQTLLKYFKSNFRSIFDVNILTWIHKIHFTYDRTKSNSLRVCLFVGYFLCVCHEKINSSISVTLISHKKRVKWWHDSKIDKLSADCKNVLFQRALVLAFSLFDSMVLVDMNIFCDSWHKDKAQHTSHFLIKLIAYSKRHKFNAILTWFSWKWNKQQQQREKNATQFLVFFHIFLGDLIYNFI